MNSPSGDAFLALMERVRKLEEQVKELKKKVKELEVRAERNSPHGQERGWG
jgi:uncharacterized protein (UPF0335 family)